MSRTIRDLLASAFLTDPDLDAFCLDCFRPVYGRFTAGMDRVAKVNLLLTLTEEGLIMRRLVEWTGRLAQEPIGARTPLLPPPLAASTAPVSGPISGLATPLELSIGHLKRACARLVAGPSQGTGYLVRPDRLVTCAHVVRDVGLGGTVLAELYETAAPVAATVEQIEPDADFAVLRLAAPLLDRSCLPVAAQVGAEARWVAFGFPASTGAQGVALGGMVRDPQARDARGTPAVQLFCEEAAAARGALLQGASGSPVLCGGAVIGHLRRVLPDDEGRAQFGLIFACPVTTFSGILPQAAVPRPFQVCTPQSEYDPLWYVPRRDAELLALNRLRAPHGTVTIQAPEGYGKSWMVSHLIERIRQQDLASGQQSQVIRFNLRKQPGELTASLEALLTELLRAALKQIGAERVDILLTRTTELLGGAAQRFRYAIEEYVLSRPAARVILLIEEGDSLSRGPTENDFFALLRALVEDHTAPFQRLRVLVTIGAEAGLLEKTDHSPFFNLVPPIVLDGFSLSQLRTEAALYGLPTDDPGVLELHQLTGGHPFYSRLAMYEAVCAEQSLAEVVSRIDSLGGLFAASLRRLRTYVLNHELKPVLRAILQNPYYADLPAEQYLKLYRKGLVVERGASEYWLRCPLFENYFRALYQIPRRG